MNRRLVESFGKVLRALLRTEAVAVDLAKSHFVADDLFGGVQ